MVWSHETVRSISQQTRYRLCNIMSRTWLSGIQDSIFLRIPTKSDLLKYLVIPSLALCAILPDSCDAIDLGSGPGIPGLIIAIAGPEIRMTCLDSRSASTEFVLAMNRALKIPNLKTLEGRAESLAHDPDFRESFDLALARSFAPMPITVEIASGFLKLGGQAIIESSALLARHCRQIRHSPKSVSPSTKSEAFCRCPESSRSIWPSFESFFPPRPLPSIVEFHATKSPVAA